jgi:hypothetical protein
MPRGFFAKWYVLQKQNEMQLDSWKGYLYFKNTLIMVTQVNSTHSIS